MVVDDGNATPVAADARFRSISSDPRVTVLRHPATRGPAAARNTALGWCLSQGMHTIIFLDADCTPPPDLVVSHLALHDTHRDVVCIGGAIEGDNTGFWSRLDGAMSWFTSMPERPEREVDTGLHIPTTNMSLKLVPNQLPVPPFDEHLRTGEDVMFIARLRRSGARIRFIPRPVVVHQDRGTLFGFLRHQYRWGRHTYFVRFGEPHDRIVRRAGFAAAFALGAPLYACVATWLNVKMWLVARPRDWPLIPFIWLTYLVKSIAVIEGALRPSCALFAPDTQSERFAAR